MIFICTIEDLQYLRWQSFKRTKRYKSTIGLQDTPLLHPGMKWQHSKNIWKKYVSIEHAYFFLVIIINKYTVTAYLQSTYIVPVNVYVNICTHVCSTHVWNNPSKSLVVKDQVLTVQSTWGNAIYIKIMLLFEEVEGKNGKKATEGPLRALNFWTWVMVPSVFFLHLTLNILKVKEVDKRKRRKWEEWMFHLTTRFWLGELRQMIVLLGASF